MAIPSLLGFFHDVFGAMYSYDHKLWRTLRILITKPGQLTVDYVEGRRICYLTPLQLFFWLQTIAFVSYRVFFDNRAGAGDHVSQILLAIGAVVTCVLAVIHVRRKMPFIVHLVAAVHIWAFLMVLLLAEYVITPLVAAGIHKLNPTSGPLFIGTFVTHCTELTMAIYTTVAIRRVYAGTYWQAAMKAAVLFACYIPFAYLKIETGAMLDRIQHNGVHWRAG